MNSLRLFAVMTIVAAFASGCAIDASTPANREAVYAPSDRASDGLLHNTILQDIADLQFVRDARALESYMSHSNPLVRARAAFASASVQSQTIIPSLLDLLSDPDARVRADAAFALGLTGDSAISQHLLQALQHEQELSARRRIIEALGKTGSGSSLAHLLSYPSLNRTERDAALSIVRFGLRDIHNEQAVNWLARRLSHADSDVRMNAAIYFGMTPTSGPWAHQAAYVRDAMEDYPMDEPAAMHLALGLGRFHGADGQLLLTRLSGATDWRVRASTAVALAALSSDARVLDALFGALNDSNHQVATAAAASISWSEAIQDEHLDRMETWIRERPGGSMQRATLLSVLASRGRNEFVLGEVRKTIANGAHDLEALLPAVALVRDRAAFTLLSGLTQSSNWNVSAAATDALLTRWRLWRGAPEGVEAYAKAFGDAARHESVSTVVIATTALTDSVLLSPGATALIEDAFTRVGQHSTDDTVLLLEILAASGSSRFTQVVRRAHQHSDPKVRRAAARAMVAITGRDVAVEDWFAPPTGGIDWALLAELGEKPTLQLETNRGTILIELFTEQAPYTVQSIAIRARHGQYDQTRFHRVVPNFIVQGGKPDARNTSPVQLAGRTEYTRVSFTAGTVGMANVGKDTEGAQFFIAHSIHPQLDEAFTAFGRVMDGMDVVVDLQQGDRIISARVIPDQTTS